MSRKRPALLSIALVLASFLIFTFRKIFEYSAAPNREKESDFVFPHPRSQENHVSPVMDAKSIDLPFRQVGGFTNDASHLNKTGVYGIVQIKTENDIRNALVFAREHNLKVTCAGQQHTMGGQTFTPGGLVLDLRNLNRITLDKSDKRVNVQSGVRWWQLQQLLDGQGLAVKSMQSINIFSIGGTLSVNAHGIDPNPGPVAPTVRSLHIMLSDGSIVKASLTENEDLFRHALGGYGLFGVILDADLDLVDNEMYTRQTAYVDYKDFPHYYETNIENNGNVMLAFGRLSVSPDSFLRETAVHLYTKTPYNDPLPPMKFSQHETLYRFVINLSKTGAMGRRLRWTLEKYLESRLHNCETRNQAMSQPDPCLVSRNEEMYDRMAYLQNQLPDTDILQEYFVPYSHMPEFVDGLREVVLRNGANLINVTIRTVHRDTVTALPYAKGDMFAFVLYFNVGFNDHDNEILQKTTTDLIDAAQKANGTYYLPYQLLYSREQLLRSYPEVDQFFAAKKKYDPIGLFANAFSEKYGM